MHHDSAAQCHRQFAHGTRIPRHDHGCLDALPPYARDNTLWQAGTDHAGIATQMVVERLCNAEGKTRHDYGREAFINKIWDWKAESGSTITRQLRRMGSSLDWSRERFTMDEGMSDAVQEVFVQLYEEGLIYRGKRLVNWDPVLHTAVSDLEVIPEETQGSMWHLRYPLANGTGHLVVATTRPETMLGDAAVAIHPGDERYKHLLGEFVLLPLTGGKSLSLPMNMLILNLARAVSKSPPRMILMIMKFGRAIVMSWLFKPYRTAA